MRGPAREGVAPCSHAPPSLLPLARAAHSDSRALAPRACKTVVAGVVGSMLVGLSKAYFFVAIGVVAVLLYAVGIAGAFGFYQRILGVYGLCTLVLSGLYFVGFLLTLLGASAMQRTHVSQQPATCCFAGARPRVLTCAPPGMPSLLTSTPLPLSSSSAYPRTAINSEQGRDRIIDACYDMCGADKGCEVGQCYNYLLGVAPAVNTVAAMGLVLAVLLACSGHLAFQLRYNAGRTGRKTARVGATAGGSSASRAAEAGRYTHLGVFPEAEEAIQLSEITESRMH